MKEDTKEIIDYNKIFNENNNEDMSKMTEKRSIYALIIYFVIFIIGIGILFGHFISALFIYPYDTESTNEFLVEYISENTNSIGFVETNSFDYFEIDEIIIANTILINSIEYDIIINEKNIEYITYLNDNLNNETSVYDLIADDNILYWNNDNSNDKVSIIIVLESSLYNFLSETIDFDTLKNDTLIAQYTTTYTTLLNFIIYMFVTIPVLFLFRREVVLDFMYYKEDTRNAVETTLSGFGLMLVFGIAANMVVLLLKGALGIADGAANQESIIASMQSNSMIFMLITSVILAPIVEELVFRKAIFSLVKSPKLSIIISSTLFSMMHILSEPSLINAIVNVIPYLTMGIFLGYFYEYKTNRNIAILISMHLLNNLLGALQILFLL